MEFTNSRKELHGDHWADCIDPLPIVHRSGIHFLSVAQTLNTLPTVEENTDVPSGDHFNREQGKPTLFKGAHATLSTSQIKMSVLFMLADARRLPSGFHATDVTGV